MEHATPAWMITDELVDAELRERFATLTTQEYRALTAALVWYAKSKHHDVVALMDQPGAAATQRVEQFERLHSGLRKLGTRIRSPFATTGDV